MIRSPSSARCVDVHLNGDALWSAVPNNVWEYTLGGYQVLKKWLSYRELPLLGRPLRDDEARYFAQVVRRIAAILLMGPALDASYVAILPAATGLPKLLTKPEPVRSNPVKSAIGFRLPLCGFIGHLDHFSPTLSALQKIRLVLHHLGTRFQV
jgi:hypothetical protein